MLTAIASIRREPPGMPVPQRTVDNEMDVVQARLFGAPDPFIHMRGLLHIVGVQTRFGQGICCHDPD